MIALNEGSFAAAYRIRVGEFRPLLGRQVLAAHRAREQMDMRLAGVCYEQAARPPRADKRRERGGA